MRASGEWRAPEVVVAAIAVGCVAWTAATPVHNYDLWHHMRMGQYILEHRTVPLDDIFSWNARDVWVNPAWASGVGMHLLWKLGGSAALVLAKVAAVALAFALIALTCRLHGLSGLSTGVLVIAVGLAAEPRFLCRPLVLAFPLLAGEWYLLRRWRLRGGDPLLLIVPLLALVWANVHASFPLSVVLVVLTWLAVAVDAGREFWLDAKVRLVALVGATTAAACFVSPFTWRQVVHALTLPQRRGLTQNPTEWWPMPFSFAYFNPGSPYFLTGYAWFWLLLAGSCVLLIVTRRKLDRADFVAFLFFAALGISARRHGAIFAIGAAPVLARQLRWLGSFRSRRRELAAGGAAVALALCMAWPARVGLGVEWQRYPVKCVDFVMKHGIDGRMFNRWGWGSYIIWRCWPERLVFADGRLEVYDEEVYRGHDRVLNAEEGWSEMLVNEYKIDYMIVPHNSRAPEAYQHPNWKLVFWDDVGLVFVRDLKRFRDLIAEYECGLTQPAMFETFRRDPVVAPKLAAALERFAVRYPDCIEAQRNLGKLRLQRKEYARAVECFARVVKLAPKRATSHHDLGLAYAMNGEADKARRQLARTLELKPSPETKASAKRLLEQLSGNTARPRSDQ